MTPIKTPMKKDVVILKDVNDDIVMVSGDEFSRAMFEEGVLVFGLSIRTIRQFLKEWLALTKTEPTPELVAEFFKEIAGNDKFDKDS